ncbi:hypothetical protein [Microbulbifer hainanensis]|uniref:hypothetical protein n=1 Tax=Microbulbifer hainanensis TaxID=2735675 RepID=UPI001866A85C|nr:hypothetical protein [Microbulbifer hainanensis]
MSNPPYIETQAAQKGFLYPFFMLHMLVFGGIGFYQAYFAREPSIVHLYLFGGFAIYVYLKFYRAIFGRDTIRWMFINAALGFWGLYNELALFLAFTGRSIENYSIIVHIIPFIYYIMYTFLLRQAVIDIFGARQDKSRKEKVERGYIGVSLAIFAGLYFLNRL